MQPNYLHHLIARTKAIYPELTSFQAPDLKDRKTITLNQEECLDLIGNLAIDIDDILEDKDDEETIALINWRDHLHNTYLHHRPAGNHLRTY